MRDSWKLVVNYSKRGSLVGESKTKKGSMGESVAKHPCHQYLVSAPPPIFLSYKILGLDWSVPLVYKEKV